MILVNFLSINKKKEKISSYKQITNTKFIKLILIKNLLKHLNQFIDLEMSNIQTSKHPKFNNALLVVVYILILYTEAFI